MSLFTQINEDIKQSMKAGEKDVVSVLRMVKSAISYVAIDSDSELSDQQVVSVLQKEAKKRKESVEAYVKAKRDDLADKERFELQVIEKYLPAAVSTEEIKQTIEQVREQVEEVKNPGQLIGQVMKELKSRFPDKIVDGGEVKKMVLE